jgi:hypothetical protein
LQVNKRLHQILICPNLLFLHQHENFQTYNPVRIHFPLLKKIELQFGMNWYQFVLCRHLNTKQLTLTDQLRYLQCFTEVFLQTADLYLDQGFQLEDTKLNVAQ